MSKSSYLPCVINELYATFGISSDEEVAIWKHSLSKERRETSTNWKVPKPLDMLGKGENKYRREDRTLEQVVREPVEEDCQTPYDALPSFTYGRRTNDGQEIFNY